ncbi:TPA: hypothetical protein ACXJN2_000741 [Serratia marcescens]
MKMKRSNAIPIKAYVAILLVLCIAVGLLSMQMRRGNTPGTCATVLQTFITVAQRPTHGVILVNTVSYAPGKMKMLFSGKMQEGEQSYTVSRELLMQYDYNDAYYPMTVEQSITRPRDTLSQTQLDKLFPREGQYLHIKIDRLDENTYAFSDNHSPMFICTTN